MRTAQQITICLWAILSLVACSGDDILHTDSQKLDPFAADTIEHTYPLQFDCEPPVYDDEAQTRATTSWSNGTTVYLRLYSTRYNSSTSSYWYPAKAVYNNGGWTITVTGSPYLTESSKCEAYYFVDPVSTYTSYINLNHLTAIYKGTEDNSTYSHSTESEWSVKTTLKPLTWRMRFRKTAYNQSFTLPSGTSNDLEFPSRFTMSSGAIDWSSSNDISLSTSYSQSGSYYYSKYIYGRFKNSSYSTSSNKLTVKYSNTESYYRNVAFNKLVAGESGYFTLPTSSNYSSYGWSTVSQKFDVTMPYTTFDAGGDYWWLDIDTDSDRSWKVTSDKTSWVHFSLTSNPPFSSSSTSLTGTGTKKVYVVCSANNTSSTRTATITVSSDGLTPKTFVITQNAGSVKFDVTMSHTNFAADGDWWWVEIDTDSDRSWTVTSNKSSWVHFSLNTDPPFSSSSTSMNGSGKKTVYVVCSANNTSSSRTATITVSSSGLTSKTFTITQEAKAQTAPFTITSVDIGNIEYDGTIINSFGSTIYSYQTKYLTPKLYVTVNTPGTYTIYFKLYTPNGYLSTGTSSPTGYSSSRSVSLTSSTTYCYLNGWGSSTAGHWSSGQYHWEFYYNGEKIFDKYHTIY